MIEKIEMIFEECDAHVKRMQSARNKVLEKLPLELQTYQNLTEEEIEHFDQYLFRFTKLQDAIGARLFKSILKALQEDTEKMSFLDILNRLEKLEILKNIESWVQLRETRNLISHQYGINDVETMESLNLIMPKHSQIIEIYESIKSYYKNRIRPNYL